MPAQRYAFGDYTLDLGRGALLRAGTDVKLRPKSYEVLHFLVERHGRLVTKDELLDAFAARYGDRMYFGADRYAGNGDAVMGFWFFQQEVVAQPDGTFDRPSIWRLTRSFLLVLVLRLLHDLLEVVHPATNVVTMLVLLAPLPYNVFLLAAVWRTADLAAPRTASTVRAGSALWLVLATLL